MRREKRGGRKPHVAEERPVEHVARPGAKVKASTRKETETRRSRKVAQEQESVPGSPMGVKIESGLTASVTTSDIRRGNMVRHLDREMMRVIRLGKL